MAIPRMCLCACVWTLCNSQTASVARRDENKIIGFLIYCDKRKQTREHHGENIKSMKINQWCVFRWNFRQGKVDARCVCCIVACHRIRFHWIGQSAPIFTFVFVSAVIEYLHFGGECRCAANTDDIPRNCCCHWIQRVCTVCVCRCYLFSRADRDKSVGRCVRESVDKCVSVCLSDVRPLSLSPRVSLCVRACAYSNSVSMCEQFNPSGRLVRTKSV